MRDPGEMSRQEAIDAGLYVGTCEWCDDAIWSDRGGSVGIGSYIWHRECAERVRDLIDEALD